MRKIFFTLTLITIPILSIFAGREKETNFGGQIDIYAEYSPIEEVTISLGEEVSFTNFLIPENGLFDACNTVFGISYTPHKNISVEATYEFLYSNAKTMEHTVSISAVPQVSFGDFTISLTETGQMTYAMFDKTYTWQLVSNLNIEYAIPTVPITTYVYAEMTNPLNSGTSTSSVTATEASSSWYDEFCYGVGLDWSINDHNTLGIYYEFSHTVDSYSHLIGIGYTIGF